MPIIAPYAGRAPRLHASVFVAENAVVVGDVEVGEGSSIWFGTVVRGDVNHVRIGARTNLQDLTVVHVTTATHPTVIGDDVTVGHRAVLHGCTIRDRCLVGIGAIVMDGAVVGPDAMVGAGALVAPGTVVPPGTLVLGSPAKPRRELTPEELAFLRTSAERYAGYAARHRGGGGGA
ncbi:gamma carbonic anhydrase family protein [Anaeromyxobacter sp. Fw109-5]|uniref:gamma carbonic anhydrase family protein n=1 Tax=Anaeromyxobacter sp. (strain Fw109-5) TaxID=404589 RepID=UPI0000ED7D89|nr:gamma carbonic anhydrase family protein [Anaeromyxobacter sp. Fw109-5]ABS25726.1 transferase hexapeptide repeat [Anaeromyxobacter sp. Fw109-5]